jgi:hypothetical protein
MDKLDRVLLIIGKIVMIPVYIVFGILWLGIVPALLFGMLKAAVYMTLGIKP